MKFKKLESGRSMVEMLGVLAIIGVLSVGGIAGYSLSMRRHRANQVADIAAKYALISYNQCYQKIMNNEPTNDSSTEIGCDVGEFKFENSGIGSLPAGVKSIMHQGMSAETIDENPEIYIQLEFTDQKLCQSVASITNPVMNMCDNATRMGLIFGIKQN